MISALRGLLQEWLNHYGGTVDCDQHDEHESGGFGFDCSVCGGHLESEDEPDLDPGHDAECIQLRTCMALHGKPQRPPEGEGRPAPDGR